MAKTNDLSWMLLPISFITLGMARHPSYHVAFEKLNQGEESIVAAVTSFVFYADQLEQIGRKEVGNYLEGSPYYEVYEEFGRWWITQVVCFEYKDGIWPADEACLTELRVLMLRFFNKKDDPKLHMRLQNQFWAVDFRKEEYCA